MKRILALQNCWDDPMGHLGEIVQEYSHITCDVIKAEEEPIPALDGYDALIVLGGPQHVGDDEARHPYLEVEKVLLRNAIERDIPCLGICLGGQLLAHALGAPVTRHHMTEIGFYQVPLTEEGKADPLFQGLPGFQQVFHWHMDVFGLPEGAVHLAENENAPHQAFRIGKHAYGLQFHIELTPAMLDIWLGFPENLKDIMSTLGADAPKRIEREREMYYTTYREHSRIMFENFLRIGQLI